MAEPKTRLLRRVLIVEDEPALRQSIARMAKDWGALPLEAGDIAEARALLERKPDLMIVDVRLPDGTPFDLVHQAAHATPAPAIIVMSGQATAQEAFKLCDLGAREYVPKPITPDSLLAAVKRAMTCPPNLTPLVKQQVGRAPMRGVTEEVRDEMIEEALALSRGSRAGAAKLLGVSRQAMQQVVRARTKQRGAEEALRTERGRRT
jgi:two-component system, response regulator RegA